MFFKLGISLLCFLISPGDGCKPTSGAGQNPARSNAAQAAELNGATNGEAGPASSAGAFNACALIEQSEIAAVQGVEVQQVQPTSQRSGDLDISQCYYTAISADGLKNFSVYVQLIRLDPQSARRNALQEFWEERFGRESTERTRVEAEKKKRKKINPPARVSGIGDEAFWLGSNRGGALYVLKGDKVLRVTTGGAGDAGADIEKSKALAQKALARLMEK